MTLALVPGQWSFTAVRIEREEKRYKEQGRIHDSIIRVREGRGIDGS